MYVTYRTKCSKAYNWWILVGPYITSNSTGSTERALYMIEKELTDLDQSYYNLPRLLEYLFIILLLVAVSGLTLVLVIKDISYSIVLSDKYYMQRSDT